MSAPFGVNMTLISGWSYEEVGEVIELGSAVQAVSMEILSFVDPALSYRWDRIRLIHTIMDLQARGALNLRPVITHVIPFKQAAQGFQILDNTPDEALQVVLDFSHE